MPDDRGRLSMEELAKAIGDSVNIFDTKEDRERFAEAMCRLHRTLQQGAMRMFIAWILKLDECYGTGNYDPRNQATCRLARKIMEHCQDHMYLPLI